MYLLHRHHMPSSRGPVAIRGLGGLDSAPEYQQRLVLCSAYLPQESAPAGERRAAFEELRLSAASYAKKYDVVSLGDLNAKTRSATNLREERLLGNHCEPGERTQNGKLLLKVIEAAELVSLNGRTAPGDSASEAAGDGFWCTRRDPITKGKHTIDYVLVSESLTEGSTKFWVDYTDLDSDHHLLRAEVPCSRQVVRRRGRKQPRKRLRMEKMIQKTSKEEDVQSAEATRALYQESLAEAFSGFSLGKLDTSTCACSGECACEGVGVFVRRCVTAAEISVGSTTVGKRFCRSWSTRTCERR